MSIKSNITRMDALGGSLDSGKNPKTLAEKEAFQRYLRGDQAYKAAYNNYDEDKKGFAKEDEEYEAWLKNNGITGNHIDDEKAMLKYTKKYFPEYYPDAIEYYASFNNKPTTSANTQNKGQTYVPEAWKPTNAESDTKVETDTSTGTTSNTGTGTSTNASYDDLLAKYEELLKQFDELSKSRAVEGHNIYKDQMSSASGYADDFAKWLQDVRDVVMKEAQANPLETDWGKGILDYYGVLGENSANAVNAATAGENAGNIDSFAAANAERQRLSRYGQGVETIMGMSTERFNNMINGLNSIGVNTDILFGAQNDVTDTSANYAATLYGTDADSTAAYNELMAQLEGSGTTTINLDNDAVISKLKDVYSNIYGNPDEDIDWSSIDNDTWAEVIKTLKTNQNFSGLTDDYLYELIAKIRKGE